MSKNCQICATENDAAAPTCVACGEGSFAAPVVDEESVLMAQMEAEEAATKKSVASTSRRQR